MTTNGSLFFWFIVAILSFLFIPGNWNKTFWSIQLIKTVHGSYKIVLLSYEVLKIDLKVITEANRNKDNQYWPYFYQIKNNYFQKGKFMREDCLRKTILNWTFLAVVLSSDSQIHSAYDPRKQIV